eukprot:scaffold2988_cov123-Isochrysis_galbana.AAC.3
MPARVCARTAWSRSGASISRETKAASKAGNGCKAAARMLAPASPSPHTAPRPPATPGTAAPRRSAALGPSSQLPLLPPTASSALPPSISASDRRRVTAPYDTSVASILQPRVAEAASPPETADGAADGACARGTASDGSCGACGCGGGSVWCASACASSCSHSAR